MQILTVLKIKRFSKVKYKVYHLEGKNTINDKRFTTVPNNRIGKDIFTPNIIMIMIKIKLDQNFKWWMAGDFAAMAHIISMCAQYVRCMMCVSECCIYVCYAKMSTKNYNLQCLTLGKHLVSVRL